jgi:hypothetical protein
VPYDDLRKESIEDLVNKVQALASVASQGQVQSLAALAGRLTIEVSESLRDLSGNLFTAKRQMVERMDLLTAELKTLNVGLQQSSEHAEEQTKALVLWTKVLVGVTAAYTLITGGLLFVAIRGK